MHTSARLVEGKLSRQLGATYYRCYVPSNQSREPLIVVHGGPGFPHYYLENLSALATDRTVVFYDQLGCGRSDRPRSSAFWNPEYFGDELHDLIACLGFQKVVVLGHSWGAAVVAEFLSKPHTAVRAIFASPYLSTEVWMRDARRLVAGLPLDLRAAVETSWEDAQTPSPLLTKAKEIFFERHVNGTAAKHPGQLRSVEEMGGDIYQAMWGPVEFTINGTLSGYDATSKLRSVRIPALFTCGELDEATPEACAIFAEMMPQARIRVIPGAPHAAHLTNESEYLTAIREFLE